MICRLVVFSERFEHSSPFISWPKGKCAWPVAEGKAARAPGRGRVGRNEGYTVLPWPQQSVVVQAEIAREKKSESPNQYSASYEPS